jgi:hypothetical protein
LLSVENPVRGSELEAIELSCDWGQGLCRSTDPWRFAYANQQDGTKFPVYVAMFEIWLFAMGLGFSQCDSN